MSDLFGGKLQTYTNNAGVVVEIKKRGKHYVEPRGGADRPGTGPKGETCGSCKHHVLVRYAKTYHKCELTRPKWTGGGKTDIRVRWAACSKWEAGVGQGEIMR